MENVEKTNGTNVSGFNKWMSRPEDKLYHFGLSKNLDDLKGMFGDIKFVCTGGSAGRLKTFADIFSQNLRINISDNMSRTDRYAMWKTGPVLWINHGMGTPSLSIMLIELIKLLHYAEATDYCFIRVGTSGGIGVEPGTVICSTGAVNGLLEQKHIQYINGLELYETAKSLKIPVAKGLTLCADDFYEGQMRLDGLFCDYSEEDKLNFCHRLFKADIKNIEMESTCFASFTNRAGIPAAIICVAIINRIEDDQVSWDKSTYHEFEMRPFRIVSAFIEGCLQKNESQQN